ncbi:hypothetical protein [Nocardia nova]|uniref:hypothetical protein n=1 Tax=Nocardia nova TaxID=37330 RepID=UPI0033E8ED8D
MTRIAVVLLAMPDHAVPASELRRRSRTRARRLDRVLDAFAGQRWIEDMPVGAGLDHPAGRRVRVTGDGRAGLTALVAADLRNHTHVAGAHEPLPVDLGQLSTYMALQRMAHHHEGADPQACTLYGIAASTTADCAAERECTIAAIDVFPVDADTDDRSPILAATADLRTRLPGVRAFGLARQISTAESATGHEQPTDGRETVCVATIYDSANVAYTATVSTRAPAKAWAEVCNPADSPAATNELLGRLGRGEAAAQTWAAALTLAPHRNAELISEMRAATT